MSGVAAVGGISPPNAKTAVFEAPHPPKKSLAVFKLFCSAQLVPFHNSVSSVAPGDCSPPKDKADVLVPAPPLSITPVFKLLTDVQLVPL